MYLVRYTHYNVSSLHYIRETGGTNEYVTRAAHHMHLKRVRLTVRVRPYMFGIGSL